MAATKTAAAAAEARAASKTKAPAAATKRAKADGTKAKAPAAATKRAKPTAPAAATKRARPTAPAAATKRAKADGTKASPWSLTTPPGTSAFTAYKDDAADPPALVVKVGATELRYHLRAIEDLHAMLERHGDWMPLGGADEQKEAPPGTVEAWGRSPSNPVKGWYGLKKGLRGRFGVYVPPVLEALGLVELSHEPRNNRVRAR